MRALGMAKAAGCVGVRLYGKATPGSAKQGMFNRGRPPNNRRSPRRDTMPVLKRISWATLMAALPALALAQTPSNVKPPVAQAWIDVATFSGLGMPMGGMAGPGAGGGNPMAMLGSLLGRGGDAGGNRFGNTQAMGSGRWVDVTLSTRNNPNLAEATQSVPGGFLPAPLKLLAPKEAKPVPSTPEDRVIEPEYERPRGKLLLYWGCGATVRPGQPRVLDFATANAAELAQFFQARRATQRGTHSASGRPHWPNESDPRMVPAEASLVGEHGFTGPGVPAGFNFQIPAAQDLMPPLQVQQLKEGDATTLSWASLPTARGYFAAGMGANQREEMVLWTSSELPDSGFGLTDYQTNAAVDRWISERVLLNKDTTRCTVPAGVFPGGNAMLRMVAYGNELNLVHPPRPADPRALWEPQWAVKVRVKSMASLMLGVDIAAMGGAGAPGGTAEAPPPKKEEPARPRPLDVLRGILGR